MERTGMDLKTVKKENQVQVKNQIQIEKEKKTEALSEELFRLARDSVFVHLRFLDVAVSGLVPKAETGRSSVCSDGKNIYYNPVYILKKYE